MTLKLAVLFKLRWDYFGLKNKKLQLMVLFITDIY